MVISSIFCFFLCSLLGFVLIDTMTTTIERANTPELIITRIIQIGVFSSSVILALLRFSNAVSTSSLVASTFSFTTFASDKLREKEITSLLDSYDSEEKRIEKIKHLEEVKRLGFSFTSLEPEDKLDKLISSGIKNIWMVGPAGCGKSTMARNVANKKDLPYLCISCGIGTSATEFVGYKYPERQATRFSEFYAKPSVILIDEITALDPAVAQILNAALANDEIETTTGLVHRHPECIIIATSNTFGFGCDRQYVANNQLDASTIDRFIGGILEVNYSTSFESQFDEEVVSYVNTLRKFTKEMDVRKVLSTRMIQAGHKLKHNYFMDWKNILILNWSDNEKNQLKQWADNNHIKLAA